MREKEKELHYSLLSFVCRREPLHAFLLAGLGATRDTREHVTFPRCSLITQRRARALTRRTVAHDGLILERLGWSGLMLQLSHHLPPTRCFLLRRTATSKQRSRARVTGRAVSAIPAPVQIDGRACMRACTNPRCVCTTVHTHTHTYTQAGTNGRLLTTQLVLQITPKGSVPPFLHASMLFSSHPPTPTRAHTYSVSHLPLKFPRLLV